MKNIHAIDSLYLIYKQNKVDEEVEKRSNDYDFSLGLRRKASTFLRWIKDPNCKKEGSLTINSAGIKPESKDSLPLDCFDGPLDKLAIFLKGIARQLVSIINSNNKGQS